MRKDKVLENNGSIPKGIGIGLIVGILVTLGGAFLLAWLMDAQRVQENGAGYGVMIITFIAAVMGSITAIRLTGQHKLPVSLVTGICYYAVLLACTAMFFGGQYRGVGETALIILAGSLSVALIGARGKAKGRTGHRKNRNR